MPLLEAIGALSIGSRAITNLSNAARDLKEWLEKNDSTDSGRFYRKVKKLTEQRAMIGRKLPTRTDSDCCAVESPVLRALLNLFKQIPGEGADQLFHPPSVVYVLCDKKGNGKTHAGRALLEDFFLLSEKENLKGMMLMGDLLGTDIPLALCQELGGSNVEGWIELMLLAMATPDKTTPSILILDGVNSAGTDDVNIKFIQALYDIMDSNKNIYVVVFTQEPDIASRILACNGGARIKPLPGCYTGSIENIHWNNAPWTEEQLIQLVHYKSTGDLSREEMKSFVDSYIKAGMTPLEVVQKLSSVGRRQLEPQIIPRKKRAPSTFF